MAVDLTIPRDALLRCAQRVAKVVERRGTVPILGNVAIRAMDDGRVSLTGTDLDHWMTATTAPGAAVVRHAGETTVPALLLVDILRKASGEITFKDADKSQVVITAGRSNFRLNSLPMSDFPDAPVVDGGAHFTLEGKTLLAIGAAVGFAISTEETRYYLNGVFFHRREDDGHLVAVATDGHRLSRLTLGAVEIAGTMPAVIVPKRAVDHFKVVSDGADGSIAITVGERVIALETDSVRLVSKLIDGTFPDYQRVIPKGGEVRASLDREAMAAAIDRVAAISSERGSACSFDFAPDEGLTLKVSAPGHGEASDQMPGEISGALTIGFNARYALELLSTLTGERVEFQMSDPGSPAVITDPDDETRTIVLMPMRV